MAGWMEIDDSISRMKLKESFWNCSPPLSSLLQLWCLSFHFPPPLLAIIVLVCCVQPISLPVWGCAWDGYDKMQLKTAIHVFFLWLLSFITKLSSNKQTLKTRGFILSIAPSWMFSSNLKMIYANVISLCVIQRSQLMSELLQPNYKLTRLDIIVRLMCFSGTCLIARRLRWG